MTKPQLQSDSLLAAYRTAFEHSEQGFCLLEVDTPPKAPPDFRYLLTNSAFDQQVGLHQVVGKTIRQVVPQAEAQIMDYYDQVASTGQPIHFEDYVAALDKWIAVDAFRVGEFEPSWIGVLVTTSTERKRAEERQIYLLTLSDALRLLTDPVAVQIEASNLLGKQLRASRVLYMEVQADGDTCVIHRDYVDGVVSVAGRHSLSTYGAQARQQWLAGQTVCYDDIETNASLSAHQRAVIAAAQVRAGVGVPLLKGGRLVAILALHQSTPRSWHASEIGLVTETVERTWAAVERARAEEALRQSEEKYRRLFETMDTGFAVGEAIRDERGKMVDYRLIELNPAFEKLTGLKASEAVGKPILEVLPGLDSWWLDTYQQVVDSRETVHVEEFLPPLNRWYDVTAFHYGEEQFAAYYNDITGRKRHEANLIFLADVGQDLASLTTIDETMNVLGAKIGGHFRVADVIFSDVSDDGQTVHVTHEWHRADFPAMKGDYAVKAYFSPEFEALHRAGQIAVVRDTANDERVDAAAYARLGVGAFVNMPLIHQNRWRFNFTLNDAKPRDWRPDEIELVRELITRIWTRLESARTGEALRQSQERLRLALDASGMGTFLWYPQEDRTEPDARALTLLGLDENDTITLAEALATRIHPDDRECYAAAVASAVDVNGDGKLDLDYRIVQPDGSLHWLHIYGHTFFSGANPTRATLMYGLFLDITGRKRHEANLAFLADVSRDLVHLTTIDETMNALGAKIGGHFKASRCAFFEFNEARDEAVCKHDWHEVNEPSLVGSYRTSTFYTDEFLQIMRAGEAFVVTDREADSRADATNLAALNIASCIVIPIITGRELLFVLSIDDSRIRDWRDDEIELMRGLTTRIWARLESARAQEALQDSEEKFRLLGIASSDSIYRMSPDWTQMHQLMGKAFLADTTDPNSSWLEGYIPLEDQPSVQQVIRKAIQTKSTFELEHRVRRADGTVGWTFSRAIPVLDEQGTIREWMGAASDITARKRAEEALQANEERFRTLVQNLPDYAIFRLDAAGIITEWTEGAQRVKGYTAEEAIGQHLSLFYTPEAIATGEVDAELAKAARTGRTEREGPRIHKNGTRFFVNEIATAIYDGQGELTGFTKISRDITARKAEQEQLRNLEERTRIAVEAAQMGTWEWHLLTNEVYWNEQHFELFGMKPQSQPLNPDTFSRYLHPDDRGWVMDELNRAVREKTLYEAEFRAVREDTGQTVWMSGYGRITDEVDGRASRMSGVMVEVTERRQAEDEIRDSQQRLQIILDSIADHAILTFDPDTTLTSWNTGAEQLFDYPAAEAIGQSAQLIFTPEDRVTGELEKEMQRARSEGQTPDERDHLRKDGSRLYISGVLSPLYDADGQLLGYVKVARDLSERRGMEQALRETDRRKDEFLAMLAHELRNPMSTIRSGLQILTLTIGEEQTTGPPGSRATIAMMNRQTDQLVRLVDDLLDVSRINQGKIELHKQRIELTELVSQAAESVRASYGEQGRHLQIDLPTNPIYVDGDATRLTQVVTNLLTNGARYTGEGGQVWVSLAYRNQEALLEVRDNGIGLAPDQLMAIFELFVQVDNSLARSKGGLGLGLTLVKRLVDMHGGRVEAQSEGVGKGSTFYVYLPTLEMAPAVAPMPVERATTQTVSQRILVIDDNVDAALTLSMLLKLKGYEVHTRTSGRAGIEAAGDLQPTAILLDIGMPDLDGYETCRLIRQQSWGKALVVVALSGYGQEEDRQQTQATGFDGHLVKPVDLDALTGLLKSLLEKCPSTSTADS